MNWWDPDPTPPQGLTVDRTQPWATHTFLSLSLTHTHTHTLTVLLALCHQLHLLANWQPQQEVHSLLPGQVLERGIIHLPGMGCRWDLSPGASSHLHPIHLPGMGCRWDDAPGERSQLFLSTKLSTLPFQGCCQESWRLGDGFPMEALPCSTQASHTLVKV